MLLPVVTVPTRRHNPTRRWYRRLEIRSAAASLLALWGFGFSAAGVEGQEQNPTTTAFLPSELPPATGVQRLQSSLREISGLAFAEDGRLFAHNDEQGQIMELDPSDGTVTRRIWLQGRPRGDFEGLAIRGDTFHLVTSSGTLISFTDPGPDREAVFSQERTGLRNTCEVEGLAARNHTRSRRKALVIVCKTMDRRSDRGDLVAYLYDPVAHRLEEDPLLRISKRALADLGMRDGLNPSGIEETPIGTFLVIAARQHILLEVDESGSILRVIDLPRRAHRQVEGVAARDRELVLADEGGSRRGRLTRYPIPDPNP